MYVGVSCDYGNLNFCANFIQSIILLFCKGFLGDEVVSKAAATDIQTKKRLVTLFLLYFMSFLWEAR